MSIHVLRNRRSVECLLIFFSFSFTDSLPSLHFSVMGKPTNEHVRRHTSASRGRRCVSSGGWSTPGWLVGWLAPEALVGKLQRSLPRFISRLRASISHASVDLLSRSSPPHPVVSLVHSLALSISRGSHFSFKPHTMRQMNRICETRGSGFGG